jgi:hypothetical protein
MIRSDAPWVDLAPERWSRIGELERWLDPKPVDFYLLVRDERVVSAFDERFECIVELSGLDRIPEEIAHDVLAVRKHVDRVILIQEQSVDDLLHLDAALYSPGMDIDLYVDGLREAYLACPGYRCLTREASGSRKSFLSLARHFAETSLPPDCIVAICIFESGVLWFDVLLSFSDRRIARIASLDILPGLEPSSLTESDREVVVQAAATAFSGHVVVVFTNRSSLGEWVRRLGEER